MSNLVKKNVVLENVPVVGGLLLLLAGVLDLGGRQGSPAARKLLNQWLYLFLLLLLSFLLGLNRLLNDLNE